MEISFKDIQHCIPNFVINEYGQWTGNYVHYDKIYCVAEKGRVQVWLDKDAYDAQDSEKLICDYDEQAIRGIVSSNIDRSD